MNIPGLDLEIGDSSDKGDNQEFQSADCGKDQALSVAAIVWMTQEALPAKK